MQTSINIEFSLQIVSAGKLPSNISMRKTLFKSFLAINVEVWYPAP